MAALGILLFGIGVYIPALTGVPYAAIWRIVLAVAGGALAMLGVTFGWESYQEAKGGAAGGGPAKPPVREPLTERDRIGPSFEVYSPPEREGGPLLRRGPPSPP